jgi:hypothetical protein
MPFPIWTPETREAVPLMRDFGKLSEGRQEGRDCLVEEFAHRRVTAKDARLGR